MVVKSLVEARASIVDRFELYHLLRVPRALDVEGNPIEDGTNDKKQSK
jgi:hypothetical protein